MEVARGQQGRRVAITGMGVVSCAGIGRDAFWRGLFAPAPEGLRRVHDFDASGLWNEKELRRQDRFVQFAVAGAEEAIAQAGGIESLVKNPEVAGSIIGTGIGGLSSLEEQIEVRLTKGDRRVSPFLVPMMMGNGAAATVSMRFGLQGPCEAVVTACAAGPHAIGYAARQIAMGRCDVMLTGSAEAGMTPTGLAGFRNMTALSSSDRSMPFSADRDGFMISEGAGILVLEAEEVALARGAAILAYVDGSASAADAHHITAPAPGGVGAIRCMELAIADAGLTASDIRHVNAHGTSTPLNDAAEAEAISKVFGLGENSPIVTSTKGVTGHLLAASGAIEAIAAVLSIQTKTIPPTFGTSAIDPELPQINLVMEPEGRAWTPGPIISNSFGFGGHNGTIVISPA